MQRLYGEVYIAGKMRIDRMSRIRYFCMDVDGTLTDGKIYMGNDGEVMKAFSIKDGCGIHDLLIPAGVIPVIITGRSSAIVANRCKELGITEFYQRETNKLGKLLSITSDLSTVAYIGDDLNDVQVMNVVKNKGGVIGCPADAAKQVKAISDHVCEKNGGDGAVRDFIEWLLDEGYLKIK